jgi:hypothetical protein
VTDCYLEQSGLEESSIRRRFARARSSHLWTPEPLRRGYFSSPYALELASGLDPALIATIASSASGALRPEEIAGGILDLDAGAGTSLSGSAVISWTDQIGSHVFDDGATATRRPALEADAWDPGSGLPSILGDGTNDLLTCEDGFASSFAGGTDNAYCIAIVGQFASVPTGYHVFFACSSQTDLPQFVDFGKDEDTGPVQKWRVGRADNASGNDNRVFGTPDTNRYVWLYNFHGTTLHVYQNNVVAIGTPGGAGDSHNVGDMTLNRATVFGRSRGSSPSIQGNAPARIRRIYAWSGDITHLQAKGVSRYLMSANGI